MSIMCSMNGSCKEKKGMCGHEKMMMVIVMVGAIGGLGHWVLHIF